MKTIFLWLKAFVFRLLVSDPLNRGSEVWKKLDERLPPAIGAEVDDQDRIEQFSQQIKTLSFLDYGALKVWLKYKYVTIKQDWETTEHFTASVEQHCMKCLQVYKEHLEVMT